MNKTRKKMLYKEKLLAVNSLRVCITIGITSLPKTLVTSSNLFTRRIRIGMHSRIPNNSLILYFCWCVFMKMMTKNIHAEIIWQNILNTPNLQCIKCYTAGENNPWRFWTRFASESLPIRNKYKGSAGLLRSFALLAISRARAEQN